MLVLTVGSEARTRKYLPDLPITRDVDLVCAERGVANDELLDLAHDGQVGKVFARARFASDGKNQHVSPLSSLAASRYSKPIHCQYGTETASPTRQVAR